MDCERQMELAYASPDAGRRFKSGSGSSSRIKWLCDGKAPIDQLKTAGVRQIIRAASRLLLYASVAQLVESGE